MIYKQKDYFKIILYIKLQEVQTKKSKNGLTKTEWYNSYPFQPDWKPLLLQQYTS